MADSFLLQIPFVGRDAHVAGAVAADLLRYLAYYTAITIAACAAALAALKNFSDLASFKQSVWRICGLSFATVVAVYLATCDPMHWLAQQASGDEALCNALFRQAPALARYDY